MHQKSGCCVTQIAQTELLAELNPSFYARTGIRVGFTFGMGIFHTHLERDSQICILCDAASLFFVFKYCIFCLMGRHPLVGAYCVVRFIVSFFLLLGFCFVVGLFFHLFSKLSIDLTPG